MTKPGTRQVFPEDIRGDLEGFPIPIVQKMCEYQENFNPEVFVRNRVAAKKYGGFNWGETKEGDTFWSFIIWDRGFNLFFEKYPTQLHDLDFFMDRQIPSWYKGDKYQLNEIIHYLVREKGYTIETAFWVATSMTPEVLEHTLSKINKEPSLNLKDYESKLQGKEASLLRGDVREGSPFSGKKGKSSVTSYSLSFRECYGRH